MQVIVSAHNTEIAANNHGLKVTVPGESLYDAVNILLDRILIEVAGEGARSLRRRAYLFDQQRKIRVRRSVINRRPDGAASLMPHHQD
jgi:hypothetical protein